MTHPYAAAPPPVTEAAYCAACGVEHDAEWGVTIRRDRSRDVTAFFRLCDECYRTAIDVLKHRPDRGPQPLRGYT